MSVLVIPIDSHRQGGKHIHFGDTPHTKLSVVYFSTRWASFLTGADITQNQSCIESSVFDSLLQFAPPCRNKAQFDFGRHGTHTLGGPLYPLGLPYPLPLPSKHNVDDTRLTAYPIPSQHIATTLHPNIASHPKACHVYNIP